MKYVVSKFNDDGSIYPVYECEDEEEAMKTAYACNGVYEKVSPSLSDDQQVVLEWLKNNYDEDADPLGVICGMQKFGLRESELFDAVEPLSDQEQFQVLAAFAEWGMANE